MSDFKTYRTTISTTSSQNGFSDQADNAKLPELFALRAASTTSRLIAICSPHVDLKISENRCIRSLP